MFTILGPNFAIGGPADQIDGQNNGSESLLTFAVAF